VIPRNQFDAPLLTEKIGQMQKQSFPVISALYPSEKYSGFFHADPTEKLYAGKPDEKDFPPGVLDYNQENQSL